MYDARKEANKDLAGGDFESHSILKAESSREFHVESFEERMKEEEEDMLIVEDFMIASFKTAHRRVRAGAEQRSATDLGGVSTREGPKIHHGLRHGKTHGVEVCEGGIEERKLKPKACCGMCQKIHHALRHFEGIALSNFYTACFDRRAQKRTFLEMALAVFGPVMIDVPQILACNPDLNTLEADPALQCNTTEHVIAQLVAWLAMTMLIVVSTQAIYHHNLISRDVSKRPLVFAGPTMDHAHCI